MKAAFRALTLWLVLGGLSSLLLGTADNVIVHPATAVALFVLPLLAAWLTIWAVAALPPSRLGRIGFWVVSVAGWVTAAVLLQGRAEVRDAERAIILTTTGVGGLAVVWWAIKTRAVPAWRTVGEVAVAAAILALAVGAFAWSYQAGTHSLIAQADARWTEIGLPMAEFERKLAPSHENAGSAVVRQVLREQVNGPFYKAGTRAAQAEPAIQPSETTDQFFQEVVKLLTDEQPPADDLKLPAQSVAAFEPVAAALETDYRRILEAEPARWASDPRDGYDISVPNFLGVRKFAQLAAADSLRRQAIGDRDGASQALAAGLRLRPGLLENPTLVSFMISVAVDALLSAKQVRLPASGEDGWAAIAQDVPLLRAELLRRMQMEAWAALAAARKNDPEDGLRFASSGGGVLPRWVARVTGKRFYQRQFALVALNEADSVAILNAPATLSLPDLGGSLLEAIQEARPSIVSPNMARASKRVYATLLLREQTELIREARARLATGRPVESRDSVVLPGVRWELSVDAEKATVTTRLAGAPAWIVSNEVTGHEFWLLPLDGSVGWQFHRTAGTASRE